MHDDNFSPVAKNALQEAAGSVAELIDNAIDGVPVVGRSLGVGLSYFQALSERNNDAIAVARLGAVEDELIKLRQDFDKLTASLANEGKQPDRQDPLSQAAVASEFVASVLEARTPQKREALVHASVRQFDPRLGLPATREFWLRLIREMPDTEIQVVLLLAENGETIFLNKQALSAKDVGGNFRIEKLPWTRPDIAAYQATIVAMLGNPRTARLVVHSEARSFNVDGQAYSSGGFKLGEDGEILAMFCAAEP